MFTGTPCRTQRESRYQLCSCYPKSSMADQQNQYHQNHVIQPLSPHLRLLELELIYILIRFPVDINSLKSLSSTGLYNYPLFDPMDCSTPGLPVHHQLPEFTQTHVHCVGDAIQPSHPLSSPSPAFNLSQHQGLFKCDH